MAAENHSGDEGQTAGADKAKLRGALRVRSGGAELEMKMRGGSLLHLVSESHHLRKQTWEEIWKIQRKHPPAKRK